MSLISTRANDSTAYWYYGLCLNTRRYLGDSCQHFLLAINYDAGIDAAGFALAAEVPNARPRPATMSLVGFAQGAVYVFTFS